MLYQKPKIQKANRPYLTGEHKYKIRYSAAIALVIGLAVLNIGLLHNKADGIYQPSNVIGQTSFTNGQPFGAHLDAHGMYYPQGSYYDSVSKRLFVADTSNDRVLVYDNGSSYTDGMAASWVLGQPDFTTTGCSYSGVNDIVSTPTSLCEPKSIGYDQANKHLFVTDYHRVVVYDLSSGISNGMAASWALGRPDLNDGTCSGPTSGNRMCEPISVLYHNGLLFVSDEQRVLVFDVSGGISNGMAASHVLGQPDFTSQSCWTTQNGMCNPTGLAYDTNHDYLFVGDQYNNRVLVFDVSGGISDYMMASHVLGQPDFTSNGSRSTADGMNYTQGLAYDNGRDFLYTGDKVNSRVLVYDLSSGITDGMAASNAIGNSDLVGTSCDANLNDGDPTANGVGDIYGVTYNPADDQLLLTDSSSNRVLIYQLSGGISNCMNASRVLGQPNFVMGQVNGGIIGPQGFSAAVVSAYDSVHQRLFVADGEGSRVLVYNDAHAVTDGKPADYVLGQPDFSSHDCSDPSDTSMCGPSGVAYDDNHDRLFVTSDGRVMVYDLSGGITNGMAASWELGQPDFSTRNCNMDQISLCNPDRMTYSQATNRLFVDDSGNGRIMVYNLSGSITNGMAAEHVLGQSDFVSYTDGCSSTDASHFCNSKGMYYDDPDHRLFVTDTSNQRVIVYDLSAGITNGMAASHVLGQPDLTTPPADEPASATSLGGPKGVSYDPSHKYLYVTDFSYNRIMVYDLSGGISDDMPATGVFGQTDLNSSELSCPTWSSPQETKRAGFCEITDATFALGDNGLWATDYVNNRVIVFGLGVDIQTTSLPAGQAGSTYSQAIGTQWSNGGTTFSISSGNLPSGLSINSSSGTISGTPNSGGSYSFTVTASDNAGYTNSRVLSINISGESSGGGGNSNVGNIGSSGNSGTKTTPLVNSPPLVMGESINLDEQPGFSSDSGYPAQAAAGQKFEFTGSTGGSHTVTVDTVSDTGASLRLDSSKVDLSSGNNTTRDVDNDGKNDISISLTSIDSGKANLIFKRVKLAAAPVISATGSSAPPTTASHSLLFRLTHRVPKVVYLGFPWLLFILLSLSAARLVYLALQERRLSLKLTAQLERQKALSEEKRNFVSLSSHYLRTPVTIINGGIELMDSLNVDRSITDNLKIQAGLLNEGVNELLNNGSDRLPTQTAHLSAGSMINPKSTVRTLSGFIQISSLSAIAEALGFSLLVILSMNLILRTADLYNVSLVMTLTQVAAVLLVGVVLYGSLRSYRRRCQIRQAAEQAIAEQQELDNSRDMLVENSLAKLGVPLSKLNAGFGALPADYNKAAKPAIGGLQQLDKLMRKFTILMSLKTGSIGQKYEPVDLSQLIGQEIQYYNQSLQANNLSIKADLAPGQINQDPLLVRFVVNSLLSNAIKYSPKNAEIKIVADHSSDHAIVTIADNGPGINKLKQAQLFQPFSRAEDAVEDFSRPGVGLGLYLDKLVMDYLGGKISLDSQPDHGTTVKLSFPA